MEWGHFLLRISLYPKRRDRGVCYTYIYMYICVYKYIHTHVDMYIYMYTCVYTYTHTHVNMYICVYTYIHTHINMYIHIESYTESHFIKKGEIVVFDNSVHCLLALLRCARRRHTVTKGHLHVIHVRCPVTVTVQVKDFQLG